MVSIAFLADGSLYFANSSAYLPRTESRLIVKLSVLAWSIMSEMLLALIC